MALRLSYIALIVVTWFFLVACIFVNFLSGFGKSLLNIDFFRNDTREMTRGYMDITPADYMLLAWGIVYLWQVAWMTYVLTTVCRKSGKGFLYYSPPFLPWSLYLLFTLALACNVAWLFTWHRYQPQVALGFLVALTLALYVCLGLSVYSLHRYHAALERCGHGREAWLVVGFVHNGLGLYAAWAAVAAVANLAVVHGGAGRGGAGLGQGARGAALGVLTLELVLYMLVDMVIAERYLRFIFTPYLVVTGALVVEVVTHWSVKDPSAMFTICLLIVDTVGLVVKVAMTIMRQRVSPVFARTREVYAVHMAMSEPK